MKVIKLYYSSIIFESDNYLDNSYLSNIVLKSVYKDYISALAHCNIILCINLSKDIIRIIKFSIKNYKESSKDITSKLNKNIMLKNIINSCDILTQSMMYTKEIFPINTRNNIITNLIDNGDKQINNILEYIKFILNK